MKKIILTLAMASAMYYVQAQVKPNQDSVKGFINPEDFRVDSVKKGNEVYHNKNGKPDTLSTKPTKKSGEKPKQKAPNQATKKES